MIAIHPQTAKAQIINIGLDEHGQLRSVNVGYSVACGRHRFDTGVTWHDSAGHSIVRGEQPWLKMLEMVIARIIEDTREKAADH